MSVLGAGRDVGQGHGAPVAAGAGRDIGIVRAGNIIFGNSAVLRL